MLAELLLKWPLVRQIRDRADGTGPESMSARTLMLQPKTRDTKVARSICPYCGVGCGQLVYHRDNKVIAIEGDPESPISRGHLCPKGADSFQLVTHANRVTKVRYRAPRSNEWRDMSYEEAMRRIADHLWDSRERTFDEQHNHTTAVAHLGGAALDIEENYLMKKLFTAGLGMVCLSNQARI